MNDTRKDARLTVALITRYREPTMLEPREGECRDLSLSGMFITTQRPSPRGALVRFECVSDRPDDGFRGTGRVVWQRNKPDERGPAGMGVRFVRLESGGREALERTLDRIGSERPISRTPRPSNRAPARARRQDEALTQAAPIFAAGTATSTSATAQPAVQTPLPPAGHSTNPARFPQLRSSTLRGVAIPNEAKRNSSNPPPGGAAAAHTAVPSEPRTPVSAAPARGEATGDLRERLDRTRRGVGPSAADDETSGVSPLPSPSPAVSDPAAAERRAASSDRPDATPTTPSDRLHRATLAGASGNGAASASATERPARERPSDRPPRPGGVDDLRARGGAQAAVPATASAAASAPATASAPAAASAPAPAPSESTPRPHEVAFARTTLKEVAAGKRAAAAVRSAAATVRSEPAAARSEPAAARSEPAAARSEPAAARSEPAPQRSEPAPQRGEPAPDFLAPPRQLGANAAFPRERDTTEKRIPIPGDLARYERGSAPDFEPEQRSSRSFLWLIAGSGLLMSYVVVRMVGGSLQGIPGEAISPEVATTAKAPSTSKSDQEHAPYKLAITTQPPGARVSAAGQSVVAPSDLHVDSQQLPLQVVAELEGYDTTTTTVWPSQFERNGDAHEGTLEITLTATAGTKPGAQAATAAKPAATPAPTPAAASKARDTGRASAPAHATASAAAPSSRPRSDAQTSSRRPSKASAAMALAPPSPEPPAPEPSSPAVVVSAPQQTPMAEALDCLARGDNRCVIRALEDKAGSAREFELLIETYRAVGSNPRAERQMQSYLERFPEGQRAPEYRRLLERRAPSPSAEPVAPTP